MTRVSESLVEEARVAICRDVHGEDDVDGNKSFGVHARLIAEAFENGLDERQAADYYSARWWIACREDREQYANEKPCETLRSFFPTAFKRTIQAYEIFKK